MSPARMSAFACFLCSGFILAPPSLQPLRFSFGEAPTKVCSIPIPLYGAAARAEQLEAIECVQPALRLRHHMVPDLLIALIMLSGRGVPHAVGKGDSSINRCVPKLAAVRLGVKGLISLSTCGPGLAE